MIRLFKHYVPYWVLLLGGLDALLLLGSAEAGWLARIWQLGGEVDPEAARLPRLPTFGAAPHPPPGAGARGGGRGGVGAGDVAARRRGRSRGRSAAEPPHLRRRRAARDGRGRSV